MRLLPVLLQFAAMLAPFPARAIEHDLLVALEKKQSVISGVLNPGSVSFNGQEIYNGRENFAGLLLNGAEVIITPVSGLKTFYTSTDQAEVQLEWLTESGEKKALLKVQYPALTEFKTDGNFLYFKFNENVSAARLDSVQIDPKQSSVEIENFKDWVNTTHTLELASKGNTSQIYNLDFRKAKGDYLTTKSISFAVARGPFSANVNPTAFGLGLRLLTEQSVSYDASVMVSRVEYETGGSNTIMQRAGQLRGRYGYNPFNTNQGKFSYKRLTVGLQTEIINYVRESTFPMSFDGINSDKAEVWYLQGGPFFRWEPLQYRDFALFVSFDLRIFRTYSNISSDGDNQTLGIGYYF